MRSITIRLEVIILALLICLSVFLFCSSNNSSSAKVTPSSPTSNEQDQQQNSQRTEENQKILDHPPSTSSSEKNSQQNKKQNKDCDCSSYMKQQQQQYTSSSKSTQTNNNNNNNNNNNKEDENNSNENDKDNANNIDENQKNSNKNHKFHSTKKEEEELGLSTIFAQERELFSMLHRSSSSSSSSSSKKSTTIDELIEEEISQKLSRFFPDKKMRDEIVDTIAKTVSTDHSSYAALSGTLHTLTTLLRASYIKQISSFDFENQKSLSTPTESSETEKQKQQQQQPSKIEFFRFHSSISSKEDDVVTCPFIPTNMKNLQIVTPTNFGLIAGFSSSAIKKANNRNFFKNKKRKETATIRVATLLTGHMRSYRRCAQRLHRAVLEPTKSDLFIASYPDMGEKRYGVREQTSLDDIVNWNEVQEHYFPYLKGLFVADVPSLKRRLKLAFPVAFSNTQFSWMLYQFLLIEIGVNMTSSYLKSGGWMGGAEQHKNYKKAFSSSVIGEMSFGNWNKNIQNTFDMKKMFSSGSSSSSSSSNVGGGGLKKNEELIRGTWSWGDLWRNCGSRKKIDSVAKKSSSDVKNEGGEDGDDDDGSSCAVIKFPQLNEKDDEILETTSSSSSSTATTAVSTTESSTSNININEKTQQDEDNNNEIFFDIFIRIRPDLFVVGQIKLFPFPRNYFEQEQEQEENNNLSSLCRPKKFQLELACGNEARTARNYPLSFWHADIDASTVLVSPHHPQLEWILDKTSDLSLVAHYDTAKRYLGMYSYLSRLSQGEQDQVFVPLCTAERLWKTRATTGVGIPSSTVQSSSSSSSSCSRSEKSNNNKNKNKNNEMNMNNNILNFNRTFGWFAMLRNSSTFRMGPLDGAASERRRRLTRQIFAIVDSDKIPCPLQNGTMLTMPPREGKKGGKKKRGG